MKKKNNTFISLIKHPNPSVPVVNKNNNPLMPTTASRARRWIKSGKATGFFKNGIFCIRLNVESLENKQEIVIGIDSGSKREAFTIKSSKKTFLNIQSYAKTDTSAKIKERREVRRNRRGRKSPCRKNRYNRSRNKNNYIPPSTKARWNFKLLIINNLIKIFPITHFALEEISAKSKKGKKKWNKIFSPLQSGKHYFNEKLRELGNLILFSGINTKDFRDNLKLNKTKNKLLEVFEAHCVDSWVLANAVLGQQTFVDNKEIHFIKPILIYRRGLHYMCPRKGWNGERIKFGGTRNFGISKRTIVNHPKHGLCYVGGSQNNRLSLHNIKTGKRVSEFAKPQDLKIKTILRYIYV